LKDKDIANITSFWSEQAEPVFDESVLAQLNGNSVSDIDGSESSGTSDEEQDERYQEIVNWLQTQKEVSASLIQRRFALGYPRAARLIESFERNGIVGPANGSKPRSVLIHNLKEL
jgi:S-DNA-T family DNA segregation ATPase FtsK/SpoIIIE